MISYEIVFDFASLISVRLQISMEEIPTLLLFYYVLGSSPRECISMSILNPFFGSVSPKTYYHHTISGIPSSNTIMEAFSNAKMNAGNSENILYSKYAFLITFIKHL